MVWVSGDSSIFDCWFHNFIQSFFFLVCLLRKFLFQVRETEGERVVERGMRGDLTAL